MKFFYLGMNLCIEVFPPALIFLNVITNNKVNGVDSKDLISVSIYLRLCPYF